MIPSITGSFAFLNDPLSLFFVFVILLISAPAAVYSAGYLKGDYSAGKIKTAWLLLALFVLSMLAVVSVSNLVLFLIFWEIMSLVSYFLVIFDSEHEKSIRAGTFYIVMTHFGTALITAAFLIMYRYTHSFDALAVKEAAYLIPDGVKSAVFLLLFFGFGAKAGIVPLHIWLPMAHPQAPSHISSIMSGVMIKLGIYGIIRFAVFTLGTGHPWEGRMVMVFAAVSCLAGVIYALMEHDIKKLLAFHSVENIGIILLGLGGSMIFMTMDQPALAVFSMAAGLYHLVNHAVFKGLLFLSAGSVYKATGTRNMEKMGGLIKLMPYTAFAFLAGSMAISALPPLNGFISEWLTFQAIFAGALKSAGNGVMFWMAAASALALTSGLAAACFVKAFSVTFLAAPRSAKASEAKESPLSMTAPMLFLAALTLIFGLSAPQILRVLAGVAGATLGVPTQGMKFSVLNYGITNGLANAGAVSAWFVPAALAFFGLTVFFGVRIIYGKRRFSAGPTWGCGYYALDSRTEYTATAFSKPFRIFFSFFLRPYRKIEKATHGGYHLKYFRYETHTTPFFRTFFYEPAVSASFRLAKTVRKLQPGSIHLYLSYIFATIILLLIFRGQF
ncbi:MAG: proton-conducting transporter membrane subunit [Elusimicrobia bacterium]|nr:proton-conducting transporter membrane subunit [Elusimicrobiota bacterium]